MAAARGAEARWSTLFGAVLVVRLLYPFFNSPLTHLYSDPLRHWQNAEQFLSPSVMGSGDPFLYQLWLFLLRWAAGPTSALVLTGCGALCSAMPYGWYRALRELLPRGDALRGGILMGLWPPFLGGYAFFMNETLLLTLTGFAFWLTLRALRRRSLPAWALACLLWLAVCFTRTVLGPVAALALLWAWLEQPRRLPAALLGLLLALAIAIPSGLHVRAALGYFSPLGNLYLNEIYRDSLKKDIQIDYGPQGRYVFGSPSYYNPTFYPFSDWTTARTGVVAISIDTRKGREDWRRALELLPHHTLAERWTDFEENFEYLLFGQSWPDNDRTSLVDQAAIWVRWLFGLIVLGVLTAAVRRRYAGREWLVALCALLAFGILVLQHEGIMEGRYRKPIEPIFMAALVLAWHARNRAAERGA